MQTIDIIRRRLEYDKDRAKKFKRLLLLFAVADTLTLVKILTFYDHPLWFVMLGVGLVISIYLSVRLWLYERIKKQQLKQVAEKKKRELQRQKDMGLGL
ncbi:MAG: hypothetical protein WC473_05430 [Patescibacteria group bacterium]|jgi:hypothetical protein